MYTHLTKAVESFSSLTSPNDNSYAARGKHFYLIVRLDEKYNLFTKTCDFLRETIMFLDCATSAYYMYDGKISHSGHRSNIIAAIYTKRERARSVNNITN